MAMLRRFFGWNRWLSRAITPDHVHEANVFGAYPKLGAMLMSRPDVHTVVDVGAGKTWPFPDNYKSWYNIKLIGLDIDANEMANNQSLDAKIECDAVKGIPLESNTVDLIMVNSGIEHFADNGLFLRNAFDVLRPGGFLLAQFPGRYAPFAIVNRLLPRKISRYILNSTMSDDEGLLGFPAQYDRTDYRQFRKIILGTGFKEIYYLPGYWSSSYFEFLFPLYFISYMYDSIRFGLGVKSLSSYNLWIIQKPPVDDKANALKLYAWK